MNGMPDLTIQQFEALSLNLGIGGLILYMVFIMYRLSRESGAGRLGTLIIALSLGMGLVGYLAKTIIQFTLDV
jgi:hypothetical protein